MMITYLFAPLHAVLGSHFSSTPSATSSGIISLIGDLPYSSGQFRVSRRICGVKFMITICLTVANWLIEPNARSVYHAARGTYYTVTVL